MLHRNTGKLNHASSFVMFGAASLARVTQQEADASIEYALGHGVNHFDTAASYGEAELRMGPWMPKVRDRIFLATKTTERSKDKAKAEILRSLERLQTDHLDLLQLHAVGTLEELDACTAAGGALEAALEAQAEGLIGRIGITGHGHQAARTHLEALRRYSFDSVLLPLNYILYANPAYREDFDQLLAEAELRQTAVRVIKAIAKKPWGKEQERTYSTWYEPFGQQAYIDACVHFVLSFPYVSGLATAGDVQLFPRIVDAVERYPAMSDAEAENMLKSVSDYASPFGA